MARKVVSNTGPIIHLTEIDLINALDIFERIIIPEEVANELKKNNISIPKRIKVIKIEPQWKDTIKIIANQHNINDGETHAIALSLQEKADYFITDDLDARSAAKRYNLEVHGTLGIILRAFKEKIIDFERAIEKVRELKTESSLFITSDLIDEAIKSIQTFPKKI